MDERDRRGGRGRRKSGEVSPDPDPDPDRGRGRGCGRQRPEPALRGETCPRGGQVVGCSPRVHAGSPPRLRTLWGGGHSVGVSASCSSVTPGPGPRWGRRVLRGPSRLLPAFLASRAPRGGTASSEGSPRSKKSGQKVGVQWVWGPGRGHRPLPDLFAPGRVSPGEGPGGGGAGGSEQASPCLRGYPLRARAGPSPGTAREDQGSRASGMSPPSREGSPLETQAGCSPVQGGLLGVPLPLPSPVQPEARTRQGPQLEAAPATRAEADPHHGRHLWRTCLAAAGNSPSRAGAGRGEPSAGTRWRKAPARAGPRPSKASPRAGGGRAQSGRPGAGPAG